MRITKQSIALLVGLLIFASAIQAQKKLYFGIKGGGYTTFYKGDNIYSEDLDYKIKSLTKFHAGFFWEIPLSKHIALQPELLVYQGGYEWFRPDPLNPDDEFKGTYNSVEDLGFVGVPILLKYKLKGLGIYAGLQPDFLIHVTRKVNGEQVGTTTNGNEAKKDYTKGLNLSAVGGIEYTFNFGLGVNIRYQLGLTNITKPEAYSFYQGDNKIKTNALLYGIHWRFGKVYKD